MVGQTQAMRASGLGWSLEVAADGIRAAPHTKVAAKRPIAISIMSARLHVLRPGAISSSILLDSLGPSVRLAQRRARCPRPTSRAVFSPP